MSPSRIAGFRLGIYVFKDAEIVDFAAPYGVFSVARRYDPELDAFLIADSSRPVQAQAGFTVLPNYSFTDSPAMDAFLIPGRFGTRQEMHNRRLHEFIRSLPQTTLLTSVCTGSWVYAKMGLLDGLAATNRKEPDRTEAAPPGKVPIDRLAELAPTCRISRARVVDAGRMITAGGITSGMEMGFYLLRAPDTTNTSSRKWRASWNTARPTHSTARTLSWPRSPLQPGSLSSTVLPSKHASWSYANPLPDGPAIKGYRPSSGT